MKKVRLKVLKNYKDLTLNRTVKKGEFINVTEDRAKAILSSKEKLADIVQVETNPLPKAAQVTSRIVKPIIEGATKSNVKDVSGKQKQASPPPAIKKSKSKNAPDAGKKD